MDAKKIILLVDGDQNFGYSIARALDPQKYNFYYANSGNIGLQLAFDHQPDLILCNLSIAPINGYDVFRAFKTTSSTESAPVFFLSDKAINEANNHSIGLNEKDVIVKPDNTDDFIHYIESWFQEGRIGMDKVSDDFDTLFRLSPYGIVVFNAHKVLKANSFLLDSIRRNQLPVPMKLGEIFEKTSLQKIRHWIKLYAKDHPSVFNEPIVLKDMLGDEHLMNLKLSVFKDAGDATQYIGFFSPSMSEKNVIVNYQLAHEVCNMLKRENLAITESLEKKITQIIKSRSVDHDKESKAFFTKRENEVLRLTIEGMSIKVIADKLAISSRTVEKYRTKLIEKSGAKNIVEVIVFSLKNNLVKI